MDTSISLNKFISDTGYCSRREADKLIEAGRVLINDQVAEIGNRYYPGDIVEVDGSLIKAAKKEKSVFIALNKPKGITTTTETHVPGNIISFVNHPKRIFPIGRLDKDSEGLIFLTNDGDIVNKILRAGNRHEKEYEVKLSQSVDKGFAAKMSSGVPILGTVTEPCKVQMTGRASFTITLTQGLNRQIRRMCEALGYKVISLKRTRIMNIRLGNLGLGKWRNLSEEELAEIYAMIKDSSKTPDKTEKTKQPSTKVLPKKPLSQKKETVKAPSKAPTKAPVRATSKSPSKAIIESSKQTQSTKSVAAKKGSYKAYRNKKTQK